MLGSRHNAGDRGGDYIVEAARIFQQARNECSALEDVLVLQLGARQAARRDAPITNPVLRATRFGNFPQTNAKQLPLVHGKNIETQNGAHRAPDADQSGRLVGTV